MRLRDSAYGLFYGCTRFPDCKGTHGAHKGTGEPLGTPADKATRLARIRAHDAFDTLWKSKRMSRRGAYRWMRSMLGMTPDEAHVGKFDVKTCERLIVAVQEYEKAWLNPRADGPYDCPWCAEKAPGYQWFLQNHDCDGYQAWRRHAFR